MPHVPHLYLPPPWEGDSHPLPDDRAHHLYRVLHRSVGDPVTYTDGLGMVGEGTLEERSVRRGPERVEPAPPAVTLAVAPPTAKDRARFLVEKLGELGVARLVWLSTAHGEGRPPKPGKATAWAVAALEQSRGAWLLEVAAAPVAFEQLDRPLLAADPDGARLSGIDGGVTVAVGPEGGWAEGELPGDATRVSLGRRVLRVETAALVAAARLT